MQRPGSVLILWLWPWVADRHQHDSSRCGTRHAALSTTSSQQTHVLVLQTSADQHALEAVAAPLLFHRCCDRASKALHSHEMIGTAGCATRDPGRVCGRVLHTKPRTVRSPTPSRSAITVTAVPANETRAVAVITARAKTGTLVTCRAATVAIVAVFGTATETRPTLITVTRAAVATARRWDVRAAGVASSARRRHIGTSGAATAGTTAERRRRA